MLLYVQTSSRPFFYSHRSDRDMLSFRELGMPETEFPRRTLLGFSVNRGSPPLRFAEDRGLTLVRRL
jgi:hypothetical protein